jgi:hypothetical protein
MIVMATSWLFACSCNMPIGMDQLVMIIASPCKPYLAASAPRLTHWMDQLVTVAFIFSPSWSSTALRYDVAFFWSINSFYHISGNDHGLERAQFQDKLMDWTGLA